MKLLTSTCSAALLLALAPNLNAQTEKAEDEIIVTGRYLSINKVNAVKTPTPVIDVPQSVTIISSDEIAAQAFTNIGDITRYTPGLTISQGEGHRDAIIIRGQQTTADFFQDGVRDDVQYYRPLYNLEQVEILRGSNALLFGRGGTGGIVNRVTKKPELSDQFTALSASVDTFGAYNLSLDSNLSQSDAGGFRVNAFVEGIDNHRDFVDGTRYGVNPTALVELSPNTIVDLSYEYLNDDRVVDRGVPSVTREGSGPLAPLEGFSETFFGSPDQNFTTLTANIVRAHLEQSFSETFKGNFTAQYGDYNKAYQNLYPSDAVTVVNGGFDSVELDGYRDTTDRQNLFFQGNLVGEFETGALGHTILMGAEYGIQNTDNARFDTVFAENGDDQLVIDFTDPLSIPEFAFSNNSRDRSSEVTTLSVYAQDQIDLTEAFKLVLGARFDRFEIDVDDRIAGAQFSRTDEEITPRLGAIYKPANNVSFYASYSETFLPRSGDQFLTLNLDSESTKPQSFINQEIGAKWDIYPRLSLTAALFDLERESFLSQDPQDADQSIVIEGSNTQGVELQLTGQITDQWSINTGYTYLDGKVERADDSGNSGNRTRQTPQYTASIWNRYEVSDAFGLGLGATYQHSYFVREDNSVEVPSYIRVDALAYYDVSDSVRLQMNIENLFDAEYYPDAHSNTNISTGKPLNARFTLNTRF